MTAPTTSPRGERPGARPHARSAPALSVDTLREQAANGEIDTVLMAVPGVTGMLRGKAYDLDYFLDEVLERGAHAAAYLLTTDTDMRMLDGFALGGWEHGAGDILLRPDLGTLRLAGWAARTALVLAEACDHHGRQIPVAPRAVLARQLSRVAELGLTASLGIESEALVFDLSYGDARRRGYRDLPPVAGHNTDYALTHPPQLALLVDQIRRTAYASALPLEGIKTEAWKGQLEATFRHTDPMAAADNHTVYKLLAHEDAQTSGLSLTFMAKPFTESDGNSCHLHLSLRNEDGDSVLVDERGQLTQIGRHAVAGCLAVLRDLVPLMLPSVNSYKRVHAVPRLFAPNSVTWGYDNRTCALRVLGAGASGRIECRIPGGDAQPHLAATALLAAVTYGIEQKLELTQDPVRGSAYDLPGADLLPATLRQAADRLSVSSVAEGLLGADTVAHYVRAADHEAVYHEANVSDLERLRGFDRA